MPIDRRTCWPNEKDGKKDGARRRSIWIDPPAVANAADGDGAQLEGCLTLFKTSNCGGTGEYETMTFVQSRECGILRT